MANTRVTRRTSRAPAEDDTPAPRARGAGRSAPAARGKAPAKATGKGFYRGSEGIDRIDDELARQARRKEERQAQANKPFRFRLSAGDMAEIVVLDDAPNFFMYEHNIKNPDTGRYDIFEGCVNETENCPVCAGGSEPYYVMFLSILDLRSFKRHDGTQENFSRKLLAVKSNQQKKFVRTLEREGTLRGAIFEMTRDTDKSPAIGNDIQFVEMMSEEELTEDYVREWTDRENKRHTEDCSEVYVYEDIFEEPSLDRLLDITGAEPSVGSRRYNNSEQDDDRGARRGGRRSERDAPPPRSSRRGARQDEEEEDTPPPRSSRRGSRRDEEEEDTPPPRASRRGSRGDEEKEDTPPPRASRRGGRSTVADNEDDVPWEDDGAAEDDTPKRTSRAIRSPRARR